MKTIKPRTIEAVSSITCDRCGRSSKEDATGDAEYTSVDFVGGYGSVFGDGAKVEVDLCQHCLQATLGPWLRVSETEPQEAALTRMLDAFDPSRHGGEAFARDDVVVDQSHETGATSAQIFGLIERDDDSGALIGKIIGFPHIEFSGTETAVLAEKLRNYVRQLQASQVLALESQFVEVIPLGSIRGEHDHAD